MISTRVNMDGMSTSSDRSISLGGWFGKFFVISVITILLVTASAKIISGVVGKASILDEFDEVFLVANRHLLLLVGVCEMAVCAFLIFGNNLRLKLYLITWLGASFFIYRLGRRLMGVSSPCPCLGNAMDVLGISSQKADMVLYLVVMYLLLGSCNLLLLEWLTHKRYSPIAN